ncbi:unnamed protein product [Didymodactylos carnosus]|uniref:Uncharacterized protein n=1 Tax=Didymodactylos carnosus TaxID=1234261 RepID=A0A813V9H5_9BILA|nr:unnamed protein product [Didymodactylos carnosus]CAF0838603.1 unnamed protein product [Didymodactylos carnosus]CAF3561487.1 unnamed protein product [Didymodactylos carnosus]CAF3625771.1 unnamed protein product [Didymodactylos carnosus]
MGNKNDNGKGNTFKSVPSPTGAQALPWNTLRQQQIPSSRDNDSAHSQKHHHHHHRIHPEHDHENPEKPVTTYSLSSSRQNSSNGHQKEEHQSVRIENKPVAERPIQSAWLHQNTDQRESKMHYPQHKQQHHHHRHHHHRHWYGNHNHHDFYNLYYQQDERPLAIRRHKPVEDEEEEKNQHKNKSFTEEYIKGEPDPHISVNSSKKTSGIPLRMDQRENLNEFIKVSMK